MAGHPTRCIVFLVFEGVSLLDLAGPLESMRLAAVLAGGCPDAPIYDCITASMTGGAVATSDGVSLVSRALAELDDREIDTIVVPGAFTVEEVEQDEDLATWLRRNADRARRVCSVCAGTFLLARAGLLENKRAVTHWLHCDRLARGNTSLRVEPDAIFIRDGKIWSSAGVTTGIDLALALIEEDLSRAIAMQVARMLVVYLRRGGGQSQYSAVLEGQARDEDDRFAGLDAWIIENLAADLRVERLALQARMSPRNFARRFTEQRRQTPARAVEAFRVEGARRLLEETDGRIDAIARTCGFANEERLRVSFKRLLGISPRAYRERFRSG